MERNQKLPVSLEVDYKSQDQGETCLSLKETTTLYGYVDVIRNVNVRETQGERYNLQETIEVSIRGTPIEEELTVPSNLYNKRDKLEKVKASADRYLENNPEAKNKESIQQFVADIERSLE